MNWLYTVILSHLSKVDIYSPPPYTPFHPERGARGMARFGKLVTSIAWQVQSLSTPGPGA